MDVCGSFASFRPSRLFLPHSLSLTVTPSHSLTLTHTHAHSRTCCPWLTFTHALTYSPSLTDWHETLTHLRSRTHCLSHTHAHALSLTYSRTFPHSPTHTHSRTHTHSLSLPHSLALTHARTHARTLGCTPWCPLVPSGRRNFCVAGAAQSPLPRGRLYALASPGAVWSLQLGWSLQLLRGRRGTISTAKGSDGRPGIPWCGLVSAAFAWQAWRYLQCQGAGCMPWRPLVLFGRRSFCVAGVALSPLPRGRKYALASPGAVWPPQLLWRGEAWHNLHCPRGRMYALVSPGAVWCSQLLRGRHGSICSAKGSDVRLGVPWCRLVLSKNKFPGGRNVPSEILLEILSPLLYILLSC